MAALHCTSVLSLVIVCAVIMIQGDLDFQKAHDASNRDLLQPSLKVQGHQTATDSEIKFPKLSSWRPRSRPRRAPYKHPGCVITIDDREANALSNMLKGMMSIFTQKPVAVALTTETDNEIRYSCDDGVSIVEASIWFILNRLWLASSCQYQNEEEFQQARRQVEREGQKVSRILYNVDVKSPKGSILVDTYASTVKEVETILEDALETMDRVHKARQCNSVNVKQVTQVFEAGMQEILSLKKVMEEQRKQTDEALEALAAQREETKKALQEVESQKRETAAALAVCAHQKSEMEDALKALKSQSELFIQDQANLIDFRNGTETVIAEVKEMIAKHETRLDALENYSLSSFSVKSLSWPAAIRNQETDEIMSWATHPIKSAFLEDQIQSILSEAYSNDTKNIDAILELLAKLPQRLAQRAQEGLIFSQAQINEWSLKKIKDGQGEDVIRLGGILKPPSFVLEDQIPILVTSSYSNNTGKMDTVLAFMDKLPTQSLALTAYKALFAAVNHEKDGKDSVRLIYKMHENSMKFKETSRSSEPSFHSFLADHVHPGFLKLIAGEFFNLYSLGFGYVYLHSNPVNANILEHAAILKNSTASDRKDAKWLWQILPIPGQDGQIFHIRNKLNSEKPLSATEDDNLQLVPSSALPIVRQPKAGFTFATNLVFNMWNVNQDAYYKGNGESSSFGKKLQMSTVNWGWGADFA